MLGAASAASLLRISSIVPSIKAVAFSVNRRWSPNTLNICTATPASFLISSQSIAAVSTLTLLCGATSSTSAREIDRPVRRSMAALDVAAITVVPRHPGDVDGQIGRDLRMQIKIDVQAHEHRESVRLGQRFEPPKPRARLAGEGRLGGGVRP